MRDDTNMHWIEVLKCSLIGYHKGYWVILTAGRWSWKLKSAKECVTTHVPNGLVPKMDGAQACDRYSIIVVTRCSNE